MELNINNEPIENDGGFREQVNDADDKIISIMALISVLKERKDYASGHDFPNIPFGD